MHIWEEDGSPLLTKAEVIFKLHSILKIIWLATVSTIRTTVKNPSKCLYATQNCLYGKGNGLLKEVASVRVAGEQMKFHPLPESLQPVVLGTAL